MKTLEKAQKPEDITRLFVERANAKDPAGIAALYEENAVMAYPPGEFTRGRDAIQAFWEENLSKMPEFPTEKPLPTLMTGDLALTSTPDRAQVVRRQADGSWLRVLDQPELNPS